MPIVLEKAEFAGLRRRERHFKPTRSQVQTRGEREPRKQRQNAQFHMWNLKCRQEVLPVESVTKQSVVGKGQAALCKEYKDHHVDSVHRMREQLRAELLIHDAYPGCLSLNEYCQLAISAVSMDSPTTGETLKGTTSSLPNTSRHFPYHYCLYSSRPQLFSYCCMPFGMTLHPDMI